MWVVGWISQLCGLIHFKFCGLIPFDSQVHSASSRILEL